MIEFVQRVLTGVVPLLANKCLLHSTTETPILHISFYFELVVPSFGH